VELIETFTFTRQMSALLSDEEYRNFNPGWQRIQVLALSSRVVAEYERFAWRLVRRGKRGGARIIYYWAVRKDMILLLYACAKNVSADLTPGQVAQLAKVVKDEFRDES
jgi:hypothetical protein